MNKEHEGIRFANISKVAAKTGSCLVSKSKSGREKSRDYFLPKCHIRAAEIYLVKVDYDLKIKPNKEIQTLLN